MSALTGSDVFGVSWVGEKGARVARSRGGVVFFSEWRCESTAEAVQALAEAEVVPGSWCDPARAPAWWCDRCAGSGSVAAPGSGVVAACSRCGGAGRSDSPANFAALLAVACRGQRRLSLAASLVDEAQRGSRVSWRAMDRSSLEEHHESSWLRAKGTIAGLRPELVFSGEMNSLSGGFCVSPFSSLAEDYGPSHATAPWWRPMEELYGLGFHLVGTDSSSATLAAERLR